MLCAAILCGFLMDLLLADPEWMPHPVVFMGRAISALEPRLRRLFPDTPAGQLKAGGILAALLPLGTLALTGAVCLGAAALHPVLGLRCRPSGAGRPWPCAALPRKAATCIKSSPEAPCPRPGRR